MAITAAQLQQIVQSVVGVFNASPGSYMTGLGSIIQSGNSIETLYNLMTNAPVFQSLDFAYSANSSNAQFASMFVNIITGATATASNKAAAVTFLAGQLESGQTRGAVVKYAVDFLSTVAASDANWGVTGLQFKNKVMVATDYTITQSGDSGSVLFLQSTIADVTEDPATVMRHISIISHASDSTAGYQAGSDGVIALVGTSTAPAAATDFTT